MTSRDTSFDHTSTYEIDRRTNKQINEWANSGSMDKDNSQEMRWAWEDLQRFQHTGVRICKIKHPGLIILIILILMIINYKKSQHWGKAAIDFVCTTCKRQLLFAQLQFITFVCTSAIENFLCLL